MSFVFTTEDDVGHPKHVLQTQNCVFLPQNNYYFRAVGSQYGTAILLVPIVVGKDWQGLMHCQPHINFLKPQMCTFQKTHASILPP